MIAQQSMSPGYHSLLVVESCSEQALQKQARMASAPATLSLLEHLLEWEQSQWLQKTQAGVLWEDYAVA